MAVKHDMVADSQSNGQAKENVQKLKLIISKYSSCDPEKVCEDIVKCLCQEQYPKATPETVKQFNETLVAYRTHLAELCSDSEMGRQLVIKCCLRSLYRQMVLPGRHCVAASTVLALFDTQKIPAAVRWMLTSGENSSDEALTRYYDTMVRWLMETTSVDNIHVWICELLSGLYEERRYDLLFELAMNSAQKLLLFVKIPVFRSQVLPVLQRLLVCDGRAPKLFHVVLPRLGEVIRSFNGQIHEQEILFLRTIQELLQQFPESGDRYKEICHILVVFKHKLSQELGSSVAQSNNAASLRLENNNPRVGLVNLGNTCYMNSVLQALVMTKHFSRELLLSYPRTTTSHLMSSSSGGGGAKTELVFTIQKLLAQLLHSRRPELTPREVLHVTRPPSFLPGHQQDSSEFLSHLMDTLHEHEMAVRNKQEQQQQPRKRGQVQQQQQRRKRVADGEGDDEEDELQQQRSVNSRHQQEEEEELLMDYEDEVDGEEEKGSRGRSSSNTLIQRSFGGLLDTTYQCLNCGETSTNRDTFRDVSLSFGMDTDSKYYVQHLLDFYCVSEKLEGDNQYHCEKCAKLCDGLRSLSFVAPPKNLILTLKHFKYDQQFHTRAKLMHSVELNEVVTLKIHHHRGAVEKGKEMDGGESGRSNSPVACSSGAAAASSSPTSSAGGGAAGGCVSGGAEGGGFRLAKYQLYAVVVHSGMSMDAGHYYTYASDEPDSWYMFNDSYVTRCAAADVHRLRPPNTPYILFYRLVETQQQRPMKNRFQNKQNQATAAAMGNEEEDESLPELEELPSYLKDFVVKDNFTYCQEMQQEGSTKSGARSKQAPYNYRNDNDSDSDEPPPPPPPSCGGNAIDSCNSYIC